MVPTNRQAGRLASLLAMALALSLVPALASADQSAWGQEFAAEADYQESELAAGDEHQAPAAPSDGAAGGHAHWSYADQLGWTAEYPVCSGPSMRQSPIDIVLGAVVQRPEMRVDFDNYDQNVEFDVKNTHHSVSLIPQRMASQPSLRLSWLPNDIFELKEIHFHWGDGVKKGSEHEINGRRAAAEMHMVHYKQGVSKDDLGNVENSVVVVGVFIESDQAAHQALGTLVSSASYVNGTNNDYHDANPHNLINLLPASMDSFYAYNGSLTTPPCYEVVTWVVLSEPVYMSNEKLQLLNNFEAATSSGVAKIHSNHREVQPLLGRPVYASYNISESVRPDRGHSIDRIHQLALNEYWQRIENIRNYVRQNYMRVMGARENIRQRLARISEQHRHRFSYPTWS